MVIFDFPDEHQAKTVARMEPSAIRVLEIPDSVSLHPGYPTNKLIL